MLVDTKVGIHNAINCDKIRTEPYLDLEGDSPQHKSKSHPSHRSNSHNTTKQTSITDHNTSGSRGKIGEVCSLLMARIHDSTTTEHQNLVPSGSKTVDNCTDVDEMSDTEPRDHSNSSAAKSPVPDDIVASADADDRISADETDGLLVCDTDDNELVLTLHYNNYDKLDAVNNNDTKTDCNDKQSDMKSDCIDLNSDDEKCRDNNDDKKPDCCDDTKADISDGDNVDSDNLGKKDVIQQVNLRKTLNCTSVMSNSDIVRASKTCESIDYHCGSTVVATSAAVDEFKPVSSELNLKRSGIFHTFKVGAWLSQFTHVTIQFDSVRSQSDRFDPIHYPFVYTNATEIYNSECHLNDLLNKIMMNKKTMNKITMNKEHKMHHNTSASNIILLFVVFDKNQFVSISL